MRKLTTITLALAALAFAGCQTGGNITNDQIAAGIVIALNHDDLDLPDVQIDAIAEQMAQALAGEIDVDPEFLAVARQLFEQGRDFDELTPAEQQAFIAGVLGMMGGE